MMSDIAPRSRPWIELMYAADQVASKPPRQRPFRYGKLFLPEQKRQHIRDRALLDDERAVHVGFAEAQFRIEQYRALRLLGGEAHRDRLPAAVAEFELPARCGRYRQGPAAYEAPQKYR